MTDRPRRRLFLLIPLLFLLLLLLYWLLRRSPTIEFVIPDKPQYLLGEIFPYPLELFGIDQPINIVQADIAFPPDRLEVVAILETDSFAQFFLQKLYDNQAGYARLSGGLPNPGYSDYRGRLGVVYLRGLKPGLAQIQISPTSLILANDGIGTNLLESLSYSEIEILVDSIPENKLQEQANLLMQQEADSAVRAATPLEFYRYTRDLPPPPPWHGPRSTPTVNLIDNNPSTTSNFWQQLRSWILQIILHIGEWVSFKK